VSTVVSGVKEDDYRYKVALEVGGAKVSEEVVSDDALAVRFLDPAALPRFLNVDPAIAAAAAGPLPSATTTKPTPQVALAGLARQRWVIDPVGAPPLGGLADDKRVQGDDPVFDALTALDYIRDAVNAGQFVKKYSPDSVDPVYRESEDPFPKPKSGSAITRYDVKPPRLPRAGATTNQETPSTAHFRKFVVYVKDGYIIEAREVIDVESKLDDIISSFRLPSRTTVDQAVAAINAVRRGQGRDTIRVRSLRFRVLELGTAIKVEVPTDALTGDLRVLKYRGRQVTPGARVPTA
jgi:hypothetical protein